MDDYVHVVVDCWTLTQWQNMDANPNIVICQQSSFGLFMILVKIEMDCLTSKSFSGCDFDV